MTQKEIQKRFERYQDRRNLYIAKTASSNLTMTLIPDPEAKELLMIMKDIYDQGYHQAVNDCLGIDDIDYPNTITIKEI